MKTRLTTIISIIMLLCSTSAFCQLSLKKMKLEEAFETVDSFRRNSMLDSSLHYYSTIYNSYNEKMNDRDKQICANAYYWTAYITYFGKGDILTAFDFYLKGLKITEKCKDKKDIQKFYTGLGDIYWTNNDLENSSQCYLSGYEFAKYNKDTVMIANIANHLAGLNAEMKDFEKANHYLKIADSINKDITKQGYLHMYVSGLIEKFKGNNNKAIEIFLASIEYIQENQLHQAYSCYSHFELYHIFATTGQQDLMKKHLFECYKLSQEINLIELLPKCLKDLSLFYAEEKDYKNAYRQANEYISFTDSVFKVKDINRLKYLHKSYQENKKTLQINKLEIEKSRNENTILSQKKAILIMALLILAIIITMVYLYWQKKKFAYLYKKLYAINTEIVTSEQHNKELCLKYERIIQEKDQELIQIKESYKETYDQSETKQKDKIKKYSTQLKEEQKTSLLKSIDHIIQDTEEVFSIDFSLDKLAKMVNSNTTYVSQAINDTYGKSFNAYVNEHRVREAIQRLSDNGQYGNYTIKAISESVGYKSQTTFIKVFKEITGMTPSMFQKIAIEHR